MEDRGLGFRQMESLETFLHSMQPCCVSLPHDILVLAQRRSGGLASTHSQPRQYKGVSG